LIDFGDYHSLGHALKIEDLLIILAGSFAEAASVRLKRSDILENYLNRLNAFLHDHVELKEARINLGILDLKLAIKQESSFWRSIRERLEPSTGVYV